MTMYGGAKKGSKKSSKKSSKKGSKKGSKKSSKKSTKKMSTYNSLNDVTDNVITIMSGGNGCGGERKNK